VEMMEGTISLESEEGRGTSVSFTLMLGSGAASHAPHTIVHGGMVKSFTSAKASAPPN
jgi:hypothetical protein